MHFSPPRLRRSSTALLLAWLFSLFIGVAQACATQAAAAPHAVPGLDSHCQGAPSDHVPGSSGTTCQKLCADATVPAPKVSADQADTAGAHALAALAPFLAWSPHLALVDSAGAAPPRAARDPHRRVPIPIAYLRLTL